MRVPGVAAGFLFLALPLAAQDVDPRRVDEAKRPGIKEILASRRDLWGEEAMRRPEGPTYEFFADLLPPLRYVNAEFRHYPLVLSAPGSAVKARLVSNGSALNARANLEGSWDEVGFPVTFRVGSEETPFGQDLRKSKEPRYHDGYLPIVHLEYRDGGEIYREEVFCGVEPPYADHATLFARFSLGEGEKGKVVAVLEHKDPLRAVEGTLRDEQGKIVAAFDAAWQWDFAKKRLTANISPDRPAALSVFTTPSAGDIPSLTLAGYEEQRKKCAEVWQALLDRGMRLEVPEPLVNDAWRSLVIGCFLLVKGDQLCYSIGNGYECQYEAECGDAVRALLLYGFDDAHRMISPLLDYSMQPHLQFHDAAFKLQLLTHYYRLTRDADFVRQERKRWEPEVNRLLEAQEPDTGLLPKEGYCADIV
jgi:hypothetical protein